jgi:peptide deformylase
MKIDLNELTLRYYPDPVLKQVCEPFELPLPENMTELVEKIASIMYDIEGAVGLAAPQVGLSKRLIVYDLRITGNNNYGYLINPQIIKTKGTMISEEGCLSFPGILATVNRPKQITVKAITDLNGTEEILRIKEEEDGFMLNMLCHEIDHLDGITFETRMLPTSQMKNKKALEYLKTQH